MCLVKLTEITAELVLTNKKSIQSDTLAVSVLGLSGIIVACSLARQNDSDTRGEASPRVSDGLKWNETFVYAPKPKPYFTGYSDIARFEDGNVAVVYERGESDENNKGERYDEIGYTVISIGGDGAT